MLDLLIRNGTVYDGTGSQGRLADVAIQGDRIVAVEPLPGASAITVIEAEGLAVAPGFIDMHSHADLSLPVNPQANSLVHQGITTIVTGQCGVSPAPLLPATHAEVGPALTATAFPIPLERWSSFSDFLGFLDETGTAVNVAPLVGHGTVRAAVMAYRSGAPTTEELAAMTALVEEAMDAGAFGISTGLIYPPGIYTATEELVALTLPVGRRGGIYFSHIRGEGDTLLEAVDEAIAIGRGAGAAVQISHFKAFGERNWSKSQQALAAIDAARVEGLDVTADMYPYLAAHNDLSAALPAWALAGTHEQVIRRLDDPATRTRIAADPAREQGDWNQVLISYSPCRPDFEGRSVAALAEAAGLSPFEWVMDALRDTGLRINRVMFGMSEANKLQEIRHPAMMVGTDGYGAALTGPASVGLPHPRSYGTFPRVLAQYVREKKALTLPEALHKMTGMAAAKLGLRDRGALRSGACADVVVFDPEQITDLATFAQPHQYAAGFEHVIVNGQPALDYRVLTGALPGKVLRK